MSEIIVEFASGNVWQPTPVLRWKSDTLITCRDDAGEALAGKKIMVLEQKWFCLDNGAEEWRSIPEVE